RVVALARERELDDLAGGRAEVHAPRAPELSVDELAVLPARAHRHRAARLPHQAPPFGDLEVPRHGDAAAERDRPPDAVERAGRGVGRRGAAELDPLHGDVVALLAEDELEVVLARARRLVGQIDRQRLPALLDVRLARLDAVELDLDVARLARGEAKVELSRRDLVA